MKTSGQALVPVLFVVLILTAFAVTVSTTARRETRAAGNFLRETQQLYIARGAINFAAAELEQATGGGLTPPQLTPPPDTDANGWTQLGDGWYKLDIIDTSSRVNINTADGTMIGKLPPLQSDPGIAAAIVDWRDADDMPTVVAGASGAESDYYGALNPPYQAKNKPFATVDELLLVRGITPELLYGPGAQSVPDNETGLVTGVISRRATRSRQGSGSSSGSSSLPAVDTSASTMPLCEMITTYSKEQNVASDGTPRVNIKTASLDDLQNKLGIPRQLAQRLITARGQSGTPLNSIADLLNIPGFTRQVMQQIGDKVTVTDAQERTGVVNINTAPAEVLATIPGVDATIYNAVIEARQNGTVFNGLNDIFQLTALNRQQLQALVDHVCTKSSVYLVRVKVRMQGSPRIYGAQALVELAPMPQAADTTGTSGTAGGTSAAPTSTPTVTILQWREVPRSPGWSSWVASPNYTVSTGMTP
jgi:type II secretory pathway component PulK